MDTRTVTETVAEGPRTHTAGQRIRELPVAIDCHRQGALGRVTGIPKASLGRSAVLLGSHTEARLTERIPIGLYDPLSPPKALRRSSRGYSVATALEAARDLAKSAAHAAMHAAAPHDPGVADLGGIAERRR